MRSLLGILLLVSMLATPILCLPGGAPSAACETLTPDHGAASSQTTPNPYLLDLEEFRDPEDGTYYYIPGVTYTSKKHNPHSMHSKPLSLSLQSS